MQKKHHPLAFYVPDMQSLLPSSFESSGHVFLAPRWPLSPVISLFIKRTELISAFFPSGSTANVCSSLTTIRSFCRTSSLSCLISPQSLMNVSAFTECGISHELPLLQNTQVIRSFSSAGDQGLIHNLILDSRLIGQLASRVWKNKDLNA